MIDYACNVHLPNDQFLLLVVER